MKQKYTKKCENGVQLRPASIEEAGLFYSDLDEKQDEALGTVGHVRMDFGHGGKEFWHTWWPHNQDQFNTPEFKATLQTVVDALRRDGPLKDLSAMRSYCQQHGGGITEDGENFGYITETEHYQFCLRCTPVPGHYQGYLYCYDKRQQEMAQHDTVVGRVTYADGTRQEFTDSELYLKTIKEELPYRNTTGFRYETLTEDPQIRKAVDDTYLYTDGLDAARRSGQIALWRASHQANIACKKAIEDSIRQGFDGVHLKEDCAKEVLEEFGFKRVNWVLANTIQEKSGDGRFRPDNRSWAQRTFIPEDMGHKVEFIVNSHSEVVNGFVNQVRDAYQKLNLFGPEHCEPNSWEDLDYAGKVLVLSPDTLRESCWTQENQLWYAHDGFGCSPHAIGRSIRCTCLGDGEHTRWNRSDFIGVLQENLLPEWAEEKLNELTGQNVDHNMEGMKME